MLALPASGAALGRATLRSADPDRLGVRQRFERALAAVDWMPPDITPRSVLVLRRLVATAPRGVATSFAHRVSLELKRSIGIARRPWLHADATSAEAVLFADEAELIACLIRDWLRGLVADRWWWVSVLAGASPERWLRQHVLPRGERLVPASSLLASRTELVPWIARLEEPDARTAIASVVRALALPVTATAAHVSPGAPLPTADDPAEPSTSDLFQLHHATELASRLVTVVPELQAVPLAPEQRRLLALVCAARRAPSWARTMEFARAMVALDRLADEPDGVAWRRHHAAPARTPLNDRPIDRSAPASATELAPTMPSPARVGTREMVRVDLNVPSHTSAQAPSGEPEHARSFDSHAAPLTEEGERASASACVAADVMSARPEDATMAATSANAETLQHESTVPSSAVRAEPDRLSTAIATSVATDYGGIFYLLNAWLAMGLYGDFTAPRAPNFVLSPWDLAALVGRAWFGDALVADPIWKTLADLAVRDPDVDPDRDRVLPERWLDEHLVALTARLRSALGTAAEADIPSIVCRHRARIAITASSVGVHLALSELPLELRIAGLDRDPGWIPAVGRSVYFHFA